MKILALFGDRLFPRAGNPRFSLSYANRRRLEIARALSLRPRLLLLDEPTAGMNPTETAEMLGIIRGLKATGITILLIEHKLDLVMQLSDRVVVMDDGSKIAEGLPAEVAANPAGHLGLPRSRRGGSHACRGAGGSEMSQQQPAPSAEPILRLDRVNTFYGPIQVHFDLTSRWGAAKSSACSAAMPAASPRP